MHRGYRIPKRQTSLKLKHQRTNADERQPPGAQVAKLMSPERNRHATQLLGELTLRAVDNPYRISSANLPILRLPSAATADSNCLQKS